MVAIGTVSVPCDNLGVSSDRAWFRDTGVKENEAGPLSQAKREGGMKK